MNNRAFGVCFCAAFLACLTIGCGGSGITEPDVAPVSGTVTVDGKPGVDLEVVFEPQVAVGASDAKSVGGSSTARTDAAGKYELKYKGADTKGAVVGNHIVRINSVSGGGPAGGEAASAVVELPAKYNAESTLTFEVKKGPNTKDFELTTTP